MAVLIAKSPIAPGKGAVIGSSPGYSVLRFPSACIKTKVNATPAVPTKRAKELTGE